MKQSGVLLHISSLCTDYGIGDLGPGAYRFAEYLAEHDHSFWQILPLNHCGYGNSPYNPISAFAWNPYLISPELLVLDNLLEKEALKTLPKSQMVDYEQVIKLKQPMLQAAAQKYLESNDIDAYIEANAWHLKPYLCFLKLKDLNSNGKWYTWPSGQRTYSETLYQEHADDQDLRVAAALQAIFEDQFSRLKSVLLSQGIQLIGDIPLYLSYESAEVWAHQELFDLDDKGRRLSVAGVPPDAFAAAGQLWGNPIYLWERLQASGFELFVRRFGHILQYIDLLRLDHFIGYVNFWKVPCPAAEISDSAETGSWVRALPEAFFTRISEQFGTERFIAEDLGILNQDVCQIRDSLGLPGMIILQFCFEESVPEVQYFPADRFIYTGTHDNHTTLGWWKDLPPNSPSRLNLSVFCKRFLPQYDLPNESNVNEIMIEVAQLSACQRMIFPLQDILGLDDDARMNMPGTALGNWQWRMDHPL